MFDKKQIKRLEQVMSVQSSTYKTERMNRFIKEQVKGIPNCQIYEDKGNLYVTKGEATYYPCAIAHTDTVHKIIKNFKVYTTSDGESMFAMNEDTLEMAGIGGDDKVGIFIALEVLRKLDNCKAAFFRDEEHGCLGSAEADKSFFDDVGYGIQCDRQGYKDVVTSIYRDSLCSEQFFSDIEPLVTRYGRQRQEFGGITDVGQLAEDGIEASMINLACGYYRPHTDEEFIDVVDVMLTLEFVVNVMELLGESSYPVARAHKTKYNTRYRQGDRYYYGYDEDEYNYNKYYSDKYADGVYLPEEEDIEDVICPHCLTQTTMEWDDTAKDHCCRTCYALLNGAEATTYDQWEFDENGELVKKSSKLDDDDDTDGDEKWGYDEFKNWMKEYDPDKEV